MLTVRQLQAFFWVAKLQNLAEAAEQLHISQSALSKRISELEAVLGKQVFDRSAYRLSLTHFGVLLLEQAGPVLAAFEGLHQLGRDSGELAGNLGFGLTELIALTWLPQAISHLRELHPRVVLEPHVDRSSALIQRIKKGRTAFAITPVSVFDEGLRFSKVADVRFSLMASPTLIGKSKEFRVAHLAAHPVLTQASTSQAARLFDEWAVTHGLLVQRVLATNSLTAIAQLVLAGLGVGFLPEGLCQPLVDEGRLLKITSLPPALLSYYSVSRKEIGSLNAAVEQVMVRCCDFELSSYAMGQPMHRPNA